MPFLAGTHGERDVSGDMERPDRAVVRILSEVFVFLFLAMYIKEDCSLRAENDASRSLMGAYIDAALSLPLG